MYSAQTLGLVIRCLSEVVWLHRDQDRIFHVARVPSSIQQSVPMPEVGDRPTKNTKAEHIVMSLHDLGDAGIASLRGIVNQLVNWTDFSLAANPESAQKLVEQLRASVEVQQEDRQTQLRAVADQRARYNEATAKTREYGSHLAELQTQFLDMMGWDDHQRRGIAFNKFLYDLFDLSGLEPREAFRIVGEEIDGAFILDYDHFLLEARWRELQAREADLLTLRGKVDGKLEGTRGLFISFNGFTDEAKAAIMVGKKPNLLLMDGEHLTMVLEGRSSLADVLRALLRRASTTGEVWVPTGSLV